MMEQFLKALLAMFADFSDEFVQESDEPVCVGDKKVGILPPDLRKWFMISGAFLAVRNAKLEEAFPELYQILQAVRSLIAPTDEQARIIRENALSDAEFDLVAHMLSLGIRWAFSDELALPLAPTDEIVICQGYVVVIRRRKNPKR